MNVKNIIINKTLKQVKKNIAKKVPLPLVVALFLLLSLIPLVPPIIDTLGASNTCGYDKEHYPLPPNTAPCSANGYQFNYEVWKHDQLKVYGMYRDVPQNMFKAEAQPEGSTISKNSENQGSYTG